MPDPARDPVDFEEILHPLEGRSIEDRLLFSFEPFSVVMHLADVNSVLEKVGEGTIRERNAAVIFCDFRVTSLGNDFPAIQFSYKLAEGFQFEIETKDGADGFCCALRAMATGVSG
jgi:hypothetical protein